MTAIKTSRTATMYQLLILTTLLQMNEANRWIRTDCPADTHCIYTNDPTCFAAQDCPDDEMEVDPNWQWDDEAQCWIELGPNIDRDQLLPGIVCSKHRPYRVVGSSRKEHVGSMFAAADHASTSEIFYFALFAFHAFLFAIALLLIRVVKK
ncbi:hypothetical protein QKT49_gp350 [Acanthamoeba castellanii medusavirus]|uniref:Uncharacterized protein n=1 Tax=Acanthamoeba castellanii medusavirus J1 TaxID=3114988 RepID=A0A3T1CX54_9VIRU|nr:hypothetical protein QKT49_gp350 [Acanthamoeba castellanii medusavirus]BBI30413.1 hypothetical protein [Acanthamoeba castellanii medusavirus J1]